MPPYSRHNCPVEATMIRGTNVYVERADMRNYQVADGNLDMRYALDLLRSNCSLAALVDSKERYDPPHCTEATRGYITRKMVDWARRDIHNIPSSIYWLYGGAGAGKSALAQTIAEKFQKNDDLAASFFFFKLDKKRNDGDRLIPTLALQLVQSFRGLAPFVEEKLNENPNLFEKSRRAQMLELILEPLINLSLEEVPDSVQSLKLHPRLVVIDGLDECLHSETQCDLLRIIADTVPHLPYPLRFLITSRPESNITRVFEHEFADVARYNLSNDSDADKDIQTFLEDEFTKIRRTHVLRQYLPAQWPLQDAISSIVERSSGHFIYAATVIRFIRSAQHRPDDRLEVIVGLKQPYEEDKPYARLDSLYTLIFLEIKDRVQLEKIYRALAIIHLRSLKIGLLASPHWTSDHHAIVSLLEFRPGDIELLFVPLLSLVTFENDIRIFHKTLFDYLLDSSRSGRFQLDLGLAHESIANHIVRQNNNMGNWDSDEFRDFVFHCQFAHLNDSLKTRLNCLASEPKIIFAKSRVTERPLSSCLLRSMLYFLQAIGRQEFESGGRYKMYVEKKTEFLRSAVPWSQRFKNMMPLSGHGAAANIKSNLIESLHQHSKAFDLKGRQRRDPNGFKGRILVPATNTSVEKTIEREHDMFSSYVEAHHRYPDITASFLQPSAGLIHSCHFVFYAVSPICVKFVMLVTYAEWGIRLSCSKAEGFEWEFDYQFPENIGRLVEAHFQTTQKAVETTDPMTTIYSDCELYL